MDNAEVSICIPVYNAEKYIKETIESILSQSFENFELIIFDNNSTDNTVNIIKTFNDKRIKLYKNDINLGMVKNWNECVKKINGKYIHFVCSDDILYKDCIKEKINLIKQHSDVVMVVSNTDIINSDGRKIFTRKFCKKTKILSGEKIAKKSFRTRNLFGEPSNVLFKNLTKEKIGYFNEKLSYTPDWEYWLRLTKHGNVAFIAKALTKYRVLPTSGTAYLLSKTKIMRADDRILIASMKKEYGEKITKLDIFSHKLVGTLRLYAKWIFVKIFTKRGKNV